jgi:tripartite ATP-independent transporter DctM subunit
MFIMLAFLTSSSGFARELYAACSAWMSRTKGGLAMATVIACAVFGAMSGSSVASSSVMSQIAYPEMRRHGYSVELSAGAVGVGATIVLMIPPSIAMVIYGIATQTSIGKLLIAGVVPGILTGIILMATIFVWVRVAPRQAPKTYTTTWTEKLTAFKGVWASVLLIFCVIAALYTGLATPTEDAAIGAFLSAVLGFSMKRLTMADAYVAVKNTLKTSIMIFLIMIGANMFGYYMTLSQIPAEVVDWVVQAQYNRWVVLSGIVIMFMDEIPLLLLTLPLTFPLITHLGFDPVWFGVMSCMMVAMGLVFPPVGLIAFVVAATAKVDLIKVYTGTSIMCISLIITTILIMIFPDIALWLPNTMK